MPDLIITFAVLIILIGLNALYVLSEFSAVSSRRARLNHLVDEGNESARFVLEIVEHPEKLDSYVATSQVGITISSLVLGFYGQARLSPYLMPLFTKFGNFSEAAALSTSATIVLIVLTLFQVLFGELIPKNLGIQNPERFSLLTLRPLKWSGWVFSPLIWLFNGSGVLLMRLIGIEPSSEHGHIHSPEEITMLIDESGKAGAISPGEYRLLSNTMRMRESMIKHIMIPRAQMLAISQDVGIAEATSLLSESAYSRIPVYSESIDNITGIVHLRDLFCANLASYGSSTQILQDILRPVQYFPESVPVKVVFSNLQMTRSQVAIILDEFGGTSGLVTLEDLIEEIFGDLQDEFDHDLPQIQVLSPDRLLILGAAPIQEINARLDIHLPTADSDTIGGLLTSAIGRIPAADQTIEIGEYSFTIQKMLGRAVFSAILIANPDVTNHFLKSR